MTNLGSAALPMASADTQLPGYDRAAVTVGIVHIGFGGFYRAHQAVYLDSLLALEAEANSFGICGVNLLPQDRRMADVMAAQDNLYTVLVRDPDGSSSSRVIGSIVNHLFAPDSPERVLQTMTDPQVRIVSLTITEGGYYYDPALDLVDLASPELVHDLENPRNPRTAFGYLAEALRRRRVNGLAPFTVMSCDNVNANGDLTRRVLTAFATTQDQNLGRWIDEEVAFPNSMVDRITPRTSADDIALVAEMTGLGGWC